MAERVSSEDPSVRTVRAAVEAAGATSRPRLALPAEAAEHLSVEIVRFVLDGTTYHADVRPGTDGEGPLVRGAYDNARLARSPGEGENRLPGWLDDVGLHLGRSVLVDVVVPDFLLGARQPGETAVYEAVDPPPTSLANIAEGLDE